MSDEPVNGNGAPAEPQLQALTAYPLIGPVQVRPGPCQFDVAMQPVKTSDGRKFVAVQIASPQGVQYYFFEPPAAKAVGEALQKLAGEMGDIEVVRAGSPLARALYEAAQNTPRRRK